ncbi:hypothetical protein Btru_031916 [Bulinus truncatus]|nr:hypothetical protein Btru_031916 [Bulinus truncatus]
MYTIINSSASSDVGELFVSTFTRVTDSSVVMETLTTRHSIGSLVQCAIRCLSLKKICYNFRFDKMTGLCTLGSWISPSFNKSVSLTTDIYTRGAFCNTTDSFQLATGSMTSYCVWLSLDSLNYTSAESACKNQNAHLYTMKDLEKLDILRNLIKNIAQDCWIGLDDIDTEGVFQWIDDKTEISRALSGQLFRSGQPDNSNGIEDCCQLSEYLFPINDRDCSYLGPFACEMNPLDTLYY